MLIKKNILNFLEVSKIKINESNLDWSKTLENNRLKKVFYKKNRINGGILRRRKKEEILHIFIDILKKERKDCPI